MQGKSFSHVQLFATLWTYSAPGFSVHGISQVGILEWIAISSSRASSRSRDQTHVSCISCISRWILYHEHHLESPWLKGNESLLNNWL